MIIASVFFLSACGSQTASGVPDSSSANTTEAVSENESEPSDVLSSADTTQDNANDTSDAASAKETTEELPEREPPLNRSLLSIENGPSFDADRMDVIYRKTPDLEVVDYAELWGAHASESGFVVGFISACEDPAFGGGGASFLYSTYGTEGKTGANEVAGANAWMMEEYADQTSEWKESWFTENDGYNFYYLVEYGYRLRMNILPKEETRPYYEAMLDFYFYPEDEEDLYATDWVTAEFYNIFIDGLKDFYGDFDVPTYDELVEMER